MCDATPRAETELPLTLEAPRAARQFLRSVGCASHATALLPDAELLVSELVTNCVIHGGPPIVVAVECDTEVLEVRVRDGSPELPVHREPTTYAESGRGIELVDIMSARWGVDAHPQGKEVWFVLAR